MAERRMFARSVIGSARFLRMPPSSRLLYYDLGMQADDDGIVEAYTVMQTTGATEDDLRILVSKGFVAVLNEDWVSYILDWNRNNLIKKDRYRQSVYANLLVRFQSGDQAEPTWNPSGTQLEPQDRLGKVSLGYSPSIAPQQGDGEDAKGESLMVETACGTSSEKLADPSTTLCAKRFADFWATYPKKVGKGAAERAFKQLRPSAELFTKMLDAISRQRNSDQWRRDNGRFIPNPSTWLNQRRWEDELGYGAGMAPDYYEETEGSL